MAGAVAVRILLVPSADRDHSGRNFGLPVAILVVVIQCETTHHEDLAYVMCGWYLVELLVQLRMSNQRRRNSRPRITAKAGRASRPAGRD